MDNGAQPSDSCSQVFRSAGLSARYERYKKGEAVDILVAEAKSAAAVSQHQPKNHANVE